MLYWMIANRRLGWNFSLDRAVAWATKFEKPLVILEALRCDYKWASDRLHRFVLDGMVENARRADGRKIVYYPYLERAKGDGKGLLAALGQRACAVVTDDFPCFFLPRMIAAAADQLSVRLEKIDSNGLLPLRAAEKVYPSAYTFRRFLQKSLPVHLATFPAPDPISETSFTTLESLPKEITERWPPASPELLERNAGLAKLPIDHAVGVVNQKGGSAAAGKKLIDFLDDKLAHYSELRNEPEREATSGLSPYLHFGHISVHQIFAELQQRESWAITHLSDRTDGKRNGWWGMSKNAEAFLDELVTWRELGYNMCWQNQEYAEYESLPDWAQKTLAEHEIDARETIYSLEEFEQARTHDTLWNAAQTQLVLEGRVHNYLRMLWGKKILEWTETPRAALDIMIHLNNKYALDGRNPNSYSGIFWILGRYDRPWGPERPIFGKVRYMTSKNTARKYDVTRYIEKYAEADLST